MSFIKKYNCSQCNYGSDRKWTVKDHERPDADDVTQTGYFKHVIYIVQYLCCPIRELEMYPKMGYKQTMYPKYPIWGTDGVQKLVVLKMVIHFRFFGSMEDI